MAIILNVVPGENETFSVAFSSEISYPTHEILSGWKSLRFRNDTLISLIIESFLSTISFVNGWLLLEPRHSKYGPRPE